MDFERFDGFWRRLAKDQLGLPEALPVGALLAKALETWTGCIVCNLLRLRAFDVIARGKRPWSAISRSAGTSCGARPGAIGTAGWS